MSLTVEEIIAAAAQLPEKDRLRLVQALSADGTDSRRALRNCGASARKFGAFRTRKSTSTKSVTRGQADRR